jgi:beta-N-acetylhexosaminidase
MRAALITGLSGSHLTEAEASFLREARPAGLILFTRNCARPDQVRRLVGDARAAIGAGDMLVLIDQEGGRVARLRPPNWRLLPPATSYAALYESDPAAALAAAEQAARLTADDLTGLGINTNCAPVLDVPAAGTHAIIADRAFGPTPDRVTALGRAVASGHLAGGVLPVVKHIPGHGRAQVDSHLELPVVDASRAELEATDFAPFRALSDLPLAMTAHVVYAAIDPGAPASTSAIVTRDVIRAHIGFDGLLMSDDLSMRALAGPVRERAAAVVRAGSDIALHCNGSLPEMEAAAAGAGRLEGRALQRLERATALLGRNDGFDRRVAEAAIARLLALDA